MFYKVETDLKWHIFVEEGISLSLSWEDLLLFLYFFNPFFTMELLPERQMLAAAFDFILFEHLFPSIETVFRTGIEGDS